MADRKEIGSSSKFILWGPRWVSRGPWVGCQVSYRSQGFQLACVPDYLTLAENRNPAQASNWVQISSSSKSRRKKPTIFLFIRPISKLLRGWSKEVCFTLPLHDSNTSLCYGPFLCALDLWGVWKRKYVHPFKLPWELIYVWWPFSPGHIFTTLWLGRQWNFQK